MKTAWSSPIQQ
jgi:hypothetical protein